MTAVQTQKRQGFDLVENSIVQAFFSRPDREYAKTFSETHYIQDSDGVEAPNAFHTSMIMDTKYWHVRHQKSSYIFEQITFGYNCINSRI